jgi:hypothetical protein
VGGLLHDARHSPPPSSLARSRWPTSAQCSLADAVVGAELLDHAVEHAVLAHDWLTARGCRAHGHQQNEYAPSVTTSNLHH